MPVNKEFRRYILEQLEPLGHINARNMFGGVGLSIRGLFFGVIADDFLYFKVDVMNRGDYEAEDMSPFKPFDDKPLVLQFYEVPIEVIEDRELLQDWADKSIEVANRAKQKKLRKKVINSI